MCFHLFGSLKNAFPAIGKLIYSNVELSEEENENKGNEDFNKASALPNKSGSYACPTVVKFSSDGRYLVYGLYDGRVIVRSVDSWQKELELNAHEGFVTGIVLLSDGRRIITSSIDGSLIMHDLENGKELKRWKPAESYVPVFSI